MGLGSSKVPRKVIKVTPVPANEAAGLDTLSGRRGPGSGADGERLRHGGSHETSKPRRSDLPPLKERLPARHITGALPSLRQVPRAISFDVNVDGGETSIIKKHPPRRFQRLEPISGCAVITSEKLLEKQRAANVRKVQAQEIQAEIAKQFSRRRQQIEKMQYEKIRQQEISHVQEQGELMINRQKETQNNKQKTKDHRANKSRGKGQNNDHQEDKCHIAIELNDIFSADYGNSWNDLTSPMLSVCNNFSNGNHIRIPEQLGKHQTQRDIFSNSSSNESLDCWMDTSQSQHRLMRTKTERIPMIDEFFDREL
ncbi:uncharacterized protein CCDC198-like [Pristis pectinata]|uniref:uncharacterized protein CCDC198-like n=1 Tax=Pristis pectinata TaxID=685728 RepID=UPI00223D559F|nr:uncharacterized protein CCDC198-like [Pristis pectinata]